MFKLRMFVCLLWLVLLSPAVVDAQEKGQTGITMGYPAAIGVVWHATDRIAIRPELQFSAGTSESTPAGFDGTSSSSWSVGVGVSALFYLNQWDGLRTYVAPRFSYLKARSSVDVGGPFGGDSTLRSSSYAITGLFGAQYSLHRRFSVFGEVGLGFTDQDSTSSVLTIRSSSNTWGTRTGVGVLFYF
jgi:hypothetical protein